MIMSDTLLGLKNAATWTAIGTVYAGGLSYVIRATNLDQKIFNFVAPKFSHACGLGAMCALGSLALMNFRVINSQRNGTYKIDSSLSLVISTFGSAYLLRQMNYTMPYLFTVVCLVPFVVMHALDD